MRQVEIPGGTATLRDEDDLTPRHKRALRDAAFAAAPAVARVGVIPSGDDQEPDPLVVHSAQDAVEQSSMSKKDWRRLRELRETAVVVQLASWSLERPLPTEETIGDLETDLYDALIAAVGGEPVSEATDFSPSPEPASPTNGSSDSPGPSSESPAPESTPTSPSDGSPSPTANSSPG